MKNLKTYLFARPLLFSLGVPLVLLPALAHAQTNDEAQTLSYDFSNNAASDAQDRSTDNTPNAILLASASDVLRPQNEPARSAGDAAAANGAQEEGVFVGSIAIEGTESLNIDTFSSLVEGNIGTELDPSDLARVTQEVADLARDRGYLFATARIPEQSLDHGILTIELNEGRIDEVRIKGSDNSALAAVLQPLEGEIARKDDIERRLVLAGDIPQIRVRRTRFLKENGKNVLQVEVRERKDRFRIRADNYGSQRIGPVRGRLSYDFNALLSDSDEGRVSVRTNPLDPSEFLSGSLSYSALVNSGGTRVGVFGSVGTNEPGQRLNDVEGESLYGEFFVSQPLLRTKDAGLWLDVKLAYLSIEQDDVIGLLSQDNQVTFSAGLSSNVKFLGGRLRAGASIEQGLDIFDATRQGNIFASRFDGDSVATTGTLYANWSRELGGNWGLFLSANGQVASRPLLAARELNIGGAFTVRGFDFSELSGENGFVALAEVNYAFNKPTSWIRRLQPYGFVDMGYVTNLENGFGSGTLVSSGLGLRAIAGPFNFEVEGAVPLNRDRDQSQNRDPHVNVRIGLDL
jgi:hemolysin activation/secretion protein